MEQDLDWGRSPTPPGWYTPALQDPPKDPKPFKLPPRTKPTKEELLEQHWDLLQILKAMDPIYTRICQKIPAYNRNLGYTKLQEAVRKTLQAKDLLEKVFTGYCNYSNAYLEWQLYLGQYAYRVKIYSVSHLDQCL